MPAAGTRTKMARAYVTELILYVEPLFPKLLLPRSTACPFEPGGLVRLPFFTLHALAVPTAVVCVHHRAWNSSNTNS